MQSGTHILTTGIPEGQLPLVWGMADLITHTHTLAKSLDITSYWPQVCYDGWFQVFPSPVQNHQDSLVRGTTETTSSMYVSLEKRVIQTAEICASIFVF